MSKARGLCTLHYQRYMSTGTTKLLKKPKKPVPHGELTGYTRHQCRCAACSAANSAYQAKWQKKYRERVRATNLRRAHGMDIAEYEELLAGQNGGCGVCGATRSHAHSRFLSVDHDHATGRRRGLLCMPCNRQLGIIELKMREWEPFFSYLRKAAEE